ncbi:hypothetical protein BDW74DRAFT_176385 [Aspergillus multicolor]|uniref:uncharacterized protein n=1 Tax=Aspergillus multicolor TaxID=41759 RepID=UPI003CCD34A0
MQRGPAHPKLSGYHRDIVLKNTQVTAGVISRTWAERVFESRFIRLQGKFYGLFTGKGFKTGDTGGLVLRDALPLIPLYPYSFFGFNHGRKNSGTPTNKDGQKRQLLNGMFTFERPPSNLTPVGLLLSWKSPEGPCLFFERLARWGCPWQLTSGGRYEFSVSEPYLDPELGWVADLRIASAHDYNVVSGEGDLERQKVLPQWLARLQRGYARVILDQAIMNMPVA